MANNLGLAPSPDAVGHFGAPGGNFGFRGLWLVKTQGVLGSKNLFCESCSQRPYYYREVISVFWFGGSKTRLPSPVGGRQTKSCSNQKTCFAKVDRSAHVTIEKWPPFFDLGNVIWPQWRCRRCGVAGGERVPRRRQAGIFFIFWGILCYPGEM